MAQPTGRPRGRPPGSKNKSTLERERKEKEKVLNESRDEIVNEVVKKVEKMVDKKMDVTTPPKGDRGIVLGGFAGTYQKVAQKGQFSLLKSEQFGDRAYMVLLKGKKVVAKDIATMNDARVVKAIGRAHRKADASRISKNTPGEMEDKFNEAAHLLIDIADWCESQGLYVTVDKVRTLVNRIDSAFEVFYDEVTAHMPSEDEFEKSEKSTVKKGDIKSYATRAQDELDGISISALSGAMSAMVDELKSKGYAGTANIYESAESQFESAYARIHEAVGLVKDTDFDMEGSIGKSKKGKVGKSDVKKYGYGDYLSTEDAVALERMNAKLQLISRELYSTFGNIENATYSLSGRIGGTNGLWGVLDEVREFGDVGLENELRANIENIEQIKKGILSICEKKHDVVHDIDRFKIHIEQFIDGLHTFSPTELRDDPIENADYDLSQYEIKSKKGSQSKAPVEDDKGSIGIDIEKMIRAKKESKEKPETDPDEPIEAPDEPPVTQGEKPETNPDEPIEAPSEPAVSDKGKDDDISSLESSAGPTVIANGNDGSELDIDIDLDDDEDLEKMMARKERMQSQAEPPGRTQPFSNNFRTVQMGAGKFNPMDMPKGTNVKP